MAEKATKGKTIKISVRLSETDYLMAKEVMQAWEIPTIADLTRELYREAYFFIRSEKQQQEQGGENDNKQNV